jgi:hypothetical protein
MYISTSTPEKYEVENFFRSNFLPGERTFTARALALPIPRPPSARDLTTRQIATPPSSVLFRATSTPPFETLPPGVRLCNAASTSSSTPPPSGTHVDQQAVGIHHPPEPSTPSLASLATATSPGDAAAAVSPCRRPLPPAPCPRRRPVQPRASQRPPLPPLPPARRPACFLRRRGHHRPLAPSRGRRPHLQPRSRPRTPDPDAMDTAFHLPPPPGFFPT